MKLIIVSISSFAVLIGICFFIMSGSVSATEKPDYTIINTDGEFEIREYPSMILAEVTVEGDRRTANNRGFQKLAAFIFGDNVPQNKVAMTSPVVSSPVTIDMTAPVTRSLEKDRRWTVNFMMPRKYTMETLPKPTDTEIRIFKSEPYKTVSIQYNGNNTVKNIAKHEAKLRAYIIDHNLVVSDMPEYAGYDAPWVPGPLKRNEVHFRLKD